MNLRSRYRNIYGWASRKIGREKSFPPKAATIEITTACNLNCVMCPRNFLPIPNLGISFSQFKEIIGKIPSLTFIYFTGLGEPMVHPEFYQMLEFCEKKGIDVVFTTNGTLLNEKAIERLPCNIEAIYFSVDSAVPEKFKKIRGG